MYSVIYHSFFNDLFNFYLRVCVCMCVCTHVWTCPGRPGKGTVAPGTGVMSSWELPDVRAGSRTQVLCKGRKCS